MKRQNILTLSHEYQMDKTQVLGKGSNGEVYLGKQLSSNQPVAIKSIRLQTINNQVTDYLLRMQKVALTSLFHDNVLCGLKIIQNTSKCYMITELCNGGTLKELIRKQGSLRQERSLQIIKGILKGYNALVRKGIVHRDLKPANIMFHNNTPKIIDFGYCQIEGYQKPSLEYNVGSPSYMAPESFEHNIYNEKTEIWAIGIILFQCLMGKTFDDGKHMSQVFKTVRKQGIPYGRQLSQNCRKIISWCLQFNPQKRPSTLQLIDLLTQKSLNQPQFSILQKNRQKTSSSYIDINELQLSNLPKRRKLPLADKKMYFTTQQNAPGFIQPQTLKKKISIKQHHRINIQESQLNMNRSNSKSKQQYGFIVKNLHVMKKVQSIAMQTNRQKMSQNYLVRNEYGFNRQPVFKTQKYFTGQNVHNKVQGKHTSAFTSGLTSPRQMQKNSSQNNYLNALGQRNPQAGKQRVINRQGSCMTAATCFDSTSTAYCTNINQGKIFKQSRLPLRKENLQSTYLSQGQVSPSLRLSSQYYQMKPSVKQMNHTANYQPITSFMNRERPSSSIYELNKFLQQKQGPISIFSSLRDTQFGQRTCR